MKGKEKGSEQLRKKTNIVNAVITRDNAVPL
jgi:hypothetical protein